MKRACLFFDTSSTGAGALMSERPGGIPVLHALRVVSYGTDEGRSAMRALFAAASDLQRQGYRVEVGAEQPQGQDTRFAQGRAIANGNIARIQDMASDCGVPWGGVYAPATPKATLGQSGKADKKTMISWANRLYGQRITELKGGLLVYTGEEKTCGEHEADAIGGAMAACAGKPYIVRKTGGRCHKKRIEEQAQGPQGSLF
jgi:hypothetical protein